MPIPIAVRSNTVTIKDEYTRPTISAQVSNRLNGAPLTGTQKISIVKENEKPGVAKMFMYME